MPHIVLQLSGNKNVDLMHQAVKIIEELTLVILKKEREVIATTVSFICDDQWFIGGEPLSRIGGSAFHADMSITDETNTKAEKAQFIRALYQALSALRGDVHKTSYIHLIDARATAYGYGGHTQEWRHQQSGL